MSDLSKKDPLSTARGQDSPSSNERCKRCGATLDRCTGHAWAKPSSNRVLGVRRLDLGGRMGDEVIVSFDRPVTDAELSALFDSLRASPEPSDAHRYALNLLNTLVDKFGRPEGFTPEDDMLGRLLQIDNVVAGLLARASVPPSVDQDGERYRWLRANGFSAKFPQYTEEMSAWNDIADNMIDAAMRSETKSADPTKWEGPTHVCIDNKTHIGSKERCDRCPDETSACPPHSFTRLGVIGGFEPEPDHRCDHCGRRYEVLMAEYRCPHGVSRGNHCTVCDR